MEVTRHDNKYRVSWEVSASKAKWGDKRPLEVIRCSICVLSQDGSTKEITSGEARQNYRDPQNAVIGQKVALAKALGSHPFTKDERTNFWEHFKKDHCYISHPKKRKGK